MNRKGKSLYWYIEEYEDLRVNHGGIAHRDIETILKERRFQKISLPFRASFSLFAKWMRVRSTIANILAIPTGSMVVYQFPLYARLNRVFVDLLLRTKKAELICCILDINGLKSGNSDMLEKEIQILKKHRLFIVHNRNMEGWLREFVPDAQIATLDFFDFLTAPATIKRELSNEICFAGNLAKSLFLEELKVLPELKFHLYGPGFNEEMAAKYVKYHGEFDPYLLPQKIEGSFGLVWDGDSIDGAEGPLGDYMQYISHHKVSLYILSGMPMLVYAKAGTASLVKQHGIGITVNSLKEIPGIITRTTAAEYQQMIDNMKILAKEISTGKKLGFALDWLNLRG